MIYEVLDLSSTGIFQGLRATEVDGISLDQVGIEPMLTDQLAEAIANARTAVRVARSISIGRLRRNLRRLLATLQPSRGGTNFFDRTESDAISLPEGTVHGPCLGDAHLG